MKLDELTKEGVAQKLLELVQSIDAGFEGRVPPGYYLMHGFISGLADRHEMPNYLGEKRPSQKSINELIEEAQEEL